MGQVACDHPGTGGRQLTDEDIIAVSTEEAHAYAHLMDCIVIYCRRACGWSVSAREDGKTVVFVTTHDGDFYIAVEPHGLGYRAFCSITPDVVIGEGLTSCEAALRAASTVLGLLRFGPTEYVNLLMRNAALLSKASVPTGTLVKFPLPAARIN